MNTTVLYSVSEGIATITLNRPHQLNAINPELLSDFKSALDQANADDDVQTIMLCGAGRAFCAGDDLKEFSQQILDPNETRAYIQRIQDITRGLCLNNKMVVGAIHGWAVGGGLEWTANCDFVVMAQSCRFFFPEISLGVFVTGGVTRLLVEQIGLQKAREMILFGERYSASDAEKLGFSWRIVEDEDVMPIARSLAQRIAVLPRGPAKHLKQALQTSPTASLEAAMALETEATLKGFLDPLSADRVRDRLS